MVPWSEWFHHEKAFAFTVCEIVQNRSLHKTLHHVDQAKAVLCNQAVQGAESNGQRTGHNVITSCIYTLSLYLFISVKACLSSAAFYRYNHHSPAISSTALLLLALRGSITLTSFYISGGNIWLLSQQSKEISICHTSPKQIVAGGSKCWIQRRKKALGVACSAYTWCGNPDAMGFAQGWSPRYERAWAWPRS